MLLPSSRNREYLIAVTIAFPCFTYYELQLDNVTGQIAKENEFKMWIYGTLLSDDQKHAALKDLASCMSSDLTLPKPLSSYNGANMAEGDV